MGGMPFILHVANRSDNKETAHWRDLSPTEDPAPTSLNVGASGVAQSRDTHTTFVEKETTDDR